MQVGSLVTLAVLFGSFAVQESFMMIDPHCIQWGNMYVHEHYFTRPGSPGCNVYYCSYKHVKLHKGACPWRGQCYDLGSYVHATKCNNYTCREFESDDLKYYKMAAAKMACLWRGQCYDLGFTVEDTRCNHYTCTEFESADVKYYMMAATKMGCQDGDKCHPVGSEYYMDGCKRYVCVKVSECAVNHDLKEQYCQVGDKCHPVGSEYYMEGCKRYVCAKVSENSVGNKLQEPHCHDGVTCQPPGSEHIRNGCERHICTRTSNETAEFKFQKEDTCCVQGKKYQDGEIYTPPGTSECIRSICSKGDVKIHTQDCQYGNKCYPIGTEFFRESCKRYRCTPNGAGGAKHVRFAQYCQDGKTCHAVGSKYFRDDCHRYQCKRINSKRVKQEIIELYCHYNNACYPVGSEFFGNDCQHFKCKQVPMKEKVILEPDGQYCQDGNTCHLIGSEYFMKGCLLHKCTSGINGKRYNKLLGPYCQHEDTCYSVGSVYTRNSCERYVCKKISDDKAEPELLKEKTCCHRGKVYTQGDIFTSYVQFQCLQFTCSEGDVIVYTEACDYHGMCYLLGVIIEQNCTILTCTKHEMKILHYEMIVTRARCMGHYGACHEEGDTNVLKWFPDSNRIFECRCKHLMGGETYIDCNDRVSSYKPVFPPFV